MEWGRGCATLMGASEVISETIRVEKGRIIKALVSGFCQNNGKI